MFRTSRRFVPRNLGTVMPSTYHSKNLWTARSKLASSKIGRPISMVYQSSSIESRCMSTEVKKAVTPSFMDFEFTNLVEMQQKACKHYAPNRLFGTRVGDNFEWMNYGDFGKLVDNTRKVLHKLGVGYNSRVAIISNNRVEWAALQFAAMGLGGQLVPMYEAQPQSDWEYIINDCGASVVVCANQSIYDKVKDYPGKLGQVKHLLSLDAAADDSINYQK
jgi:long-subunit acyl-CoA synthetase (AMP-forming)